MTNPTWLYVAFIYAAFVAIVRRAGIDLPRRVALLFYILTAVFFWPSIARESVNAPMDYLKSIEPWHSVASDNQVWNSDMNDIPLQIIPWMHQVRESWKSGHVPLWNPNAGSGYPLLANGQSSALSIVRLIALPLSLPHAVVGESALTALIALTFMFLYCRRYHSVMASIMAAISFGFCGFLTVWMHFPAATAAAFFPAVFYVIDLLAERVSFARICGAACVATLLLFAGHPETAAHMALLATLYAAWLVFIERKSRWTLLAALGVTAIIVILLATPFLLPFIEALPRSERYMSLRNHPWSVADLAYTDIASQFAGMQPNFFGNPHSRWSGVLAPDPLSAFAGMLGIAGWFAAVVHIIRTRRWRSREMFLVLAALFALAVAMSWPGAGVALHKLLPFIAHARIRLIFAFAVALLAAVAVDLVWRGGRPRPPGAASAALARGWADEGVRPSSIDRLSLLVGVGCAAGLLVAAIALFDFPNADVRRDSIVATLPSLAVLAVAAFASLWRHRAAAILLVAAAIVEMFVNQRAWSAHVSTDWMYSPTPIVRALSTALKKEREPARIVGMWYRLPSNTGAMFGFEDIRAHDPMSNDAYGHFASNTAGYKVDDYVPAWSSISSRVLDYLNVRFVIADENEKGASEPRYRLIYRGKDGSLFENRDALPRFFPVRNVILDPRDFDQHLAKHDDWANTALVDKLPVENDAMRNDLLTPRQGERDVRLAIQESSATRYRMHVTAPRYTLVVSSIPWWPGWFVERNGSRIRSLRVNGVFLGYAVAPGENDIVVHYSPRSWTAGVMIAITTALMLAALSRESLRLRLRRKLRMG